MGGKNTKVESPKTEWDNHATLDQSSAMPGVVRISQISQKYENNIKTLIQNLQHDANESTEAPLTEILNNMSLSYNTKYKNKLEENPQNPPKLDENQVIDNFAESPFLSPVKYANLLNSHTSDNAQHGGAKKSKKGKPQSKKEKYNKTHKKKDNKASKSDETTDEENNSTSDADENKTTDDENVVDADKEDEDNKTTEDDVNEEDENNAPDEDNASDEDNAPDENNVNESTSSEYSSQVANDSDKTTTASDDKKSESFHGDKKYGDDKYEKDNSSPESVHTSQINMLEDSY